MTIASLFLLMTMIQQATPAPEPEPKAPIVRSDPATRSVRGWATYYHWREGQAAAGPGLRRLLGAGWRGDSVRVCHGKRCIRVRLTDWCACGPRKGLQTVIDLDARSFRRLAPTWRGVIIVTVSR